MDESQGFAVLDKAPLSSIMISRYSYKSMTNSEKAPEVKTGIFATAKLRPEISAIVNEIIGLVRGLQNFGLIPHFPKVPVQIDSKERGNVEIIKVTLTEGQIGEVAEEIKKAVKKILPWAFMALVSAAAVGFVLGITTRQHLVP
jgi:hypothetical protein